ncbi:MAG: polysaccharide deacetylase family protein [Chthonomonadales bacterium]
MDREALGGPIRKQAKQIFGGAALFAVAMGVFGGLLAYPVHGLPMWEWWREERSGRIFSHAQTRRRVVALTFDDGPDPRYTPAVLRILKSEGVHATFFVCGDMVRAHPGLLRAIVRDGHVVGNHTDTHPHLELEKVPEIRREIEGCEHEIETVAGEHTYLFRPPRGLWSRGAFTVIRRSGYHIILWSLAFDREAIHNPAALRRRVVSRAEPGDIILLHDGAHTTRDIRRATVRELRGVIRGLKQRGFTFATVPQLLRIAGDERVRPLRCALRR